MSKRMSMAECGAEDKKIAISSDAYSMLTTPLVEIKGLTVMAIPRLLELREAYEGHDCKRMTELLEVIRIELG